MEKFEYHFIYESDQSFSNLFTWTAATTTSEAVFCPANVDEHFVFESLGAEVHSTGMSFIEETVH